MKALALIAILLAGCSISIGATKHINRITLGMALLTTACDYGQTRSAATKGWHDRYEGNPIMGPTPSTHTVDLYMLGAMVGTIALGQLIPARFRALLYGAVTIVEVHTVVGNLETTDGICGVSGDPVH